MRRRWTTVPIAVALGWAAVGCTASTTDSPADDTPGTTSAAAAPDGTTAPVASGTGVASDTLLVVSAGSGEVAIGSGVLKVTLQEAPTAVWLADRPGRTGGSVEVTELVEDWSDYGFTDSPPAAAVEAGGAALSFTIEEIEIEDGALVASGPLLGADDAAVEQMPDRFGASALFIDAAGTTPPGDDSISCEDVNVDWPLETVADGQFLTVGDYNRWICALNELHEQVDP